MIYKTSQLNYSLN